MRNQLLPRVLSIVLFSAATPAAAQSAPPPGDESEAVQPPGPPPEQPVPPLPPPPPSGQAVPVAPPAAPYAAEPAGERGQWVYTSQYGWLWMPHDRSYTYVAPDSSVADVFVYYPAQGWRWVAAPWIFGLGPRPFWGAVGPARFAWYGHPWFRVGPGWWGHHGGWGYRGAGYRAGFGYRGAWGGHVHPMAPPRAPGFHGHFGGHHR